MAIDIVTTKNLHKESNMLQDMINSNNVDTLNLALSIVEKDNSLDKLLSSNLDKNANIKELDMKRCWYFIFTPDISGQYSTFPLIYDNNRIKECAAYYFSQKNLGNAAKLIKIEL